MRITIEPTTRIVNLSTEGGSDVAQARVWEGKTEGGKPVSLVVVRIAARDGQHEELERALVETRPPAVDSAYAWPLRLVL